MKEGMTRRTVDLDRNEYRTLQIIQEKMKVRSQADAIRKCLIIVSKLYALGDNEELLIVNDKHEATRLLLI